VRNQASDVRSGCRPGSFSRRARRLSGIEHQRHDHHDNDSQQNTDQQQGAGIGKVLFKPHRLFIAQPAYIAVNRQAAGKQAQQQSENFADQRRREIRRQLVQADAAG